MHLKVDGYPNRTEAATALPPDVVGRNSEIFANLNAASPNP